MGDWDSVVLGQSRPEGMTTKCNALSFFKKKFLWELFLTSLLTVTILLLLLLFVFWDSGREAPGIFAP